MDFEPRILAFLCTWCSYTGADTAGIARIQSPANLRAVRVPCSGRVSPELVLRAFDQGADGVLVLGCHVGECHFDTGNHRAAKRLPVLQRLLQFAGLEPERFRLDWVSASEGERFARIATEFTQAVRTLGPAQWKAAARTERPFSEPFTWELPPAPYPGTDCASKTDALQATARQLLSSGQVACVIGYELSPRGRTRPAFVYAPQEADRLVWNPDVTNNLAVYLPEKLRTKGGEPPRPVAVVVKPCDSRAIHVQLAERQYTRDRVHVIGVTCDGIRAADGNLQVRCQTCDERTPVVYDTLIGAAPATARGGHLTEVDRLDALTPAGRMEFWLGQFDRCIRCYACRQACPLCNCPTCLYERDDSTWVGLRIGLDEKRTFHLGRAWHLAGRCVGCNECERACPMELPISLLNQKLAEAIEQAFGFRAGRAVASSPVVTVLDGEYREG